MKAIQFDRLGGPEVMELPAIPTDEPDNIDSDEQRMARYATVEWLICGERIHVQ